MKVSSYSIFTSDLWNKGVAYAVKHAKETGFEAVEFLDYHSPNRPELPLTFNPEEVNAALAENGLTVSCYSLGVRLQKGEPEETLAYVYRQIAFAAKVGSPFFHHTVTLDCSPNENDPTYREMLKKVLPLTVAIANKCAEYGITCLYEPQGLYFNGVRGLPGFFKIMRKHCPNVAICGDLGNSYDIDENPVKVIRKMAKYVQHVHIKDCKYDVEIPGEPPSYTSARGKNIYECEIGTGHVDLARCFAYLRRVGYDGYVSFEVQGDDETMKKSIAYVRALAEGK